MKTNEEVLAALDELASSTRKLTAELDELQRKISAAKQYIGEANEESNECEIHSLPGLGSNGTTARHGLQFVLGKDDDGKDVVVDLWRIPHLLIGGVSGSGKTSCLNVLIVSLVSSRSPNEVRFILSDPKMVEFTSMCNLPHLLMPILHSDEEHIAALRWLRDEVARRFALLRSDRYHDRNIDEFNERKTSRGECGEPHIVVVLDEIAELKESLKSDDALLALARINNYGRAIGIHIVASTRTIDRETTREALKVNFDNLVAFRTFNDVDSKMLVSAAGAEKLTCPGEFLFRDAGLVNVVHGQGCFVFARKMQEIIDEASAKYGVLDFVSLERTEAAKHEVAE